MRQIHARNLKADHRLERGADVYTSSFCHKLGRLDTQCLRDLTKDGDGCRHLGALDCPDMADAKSSPVRQFLLRQFPAMAYSTQIHRHDLLEIHDESGA